MVASKTLLLALALLVPPEGIGPKEPKDIVVPKGACSVDAVGYILQIPARHAQKARELARDLIGQMPDVREPELSRRHEFALSFEEPADPKKKLVFRFYYSASFLEILHDGKVLRRATVNGATAKTMIEGCFGLVKDVDLLINCIKSEDGNTRYNAAVCLSGISGQVPGIDVHARTIARTAKEERDWETAMRLVVVLLRENNELETARNVFLKFLRDRDGDIEKTRELIGALRELKEGGRVIMPDLLPFLQSTDEGLVLDVLNAMQGTIIPLKNAFPILEKLTRHNNGLIRWRAIGALGSTDVVENAETLLPVITKGLSDKDSGVIYKCQLLLKRMKHKAKPAVEPLIACLTNDSPSVRRNSIDLVLGFDLENKEALQALVKELRNEDTNEKIFALDIWLLHPGADSGGLRNELRLLLAHPDEEVRRLAEQLHMVRENKA